jgi:acyl carrier protein
MIWPGHARALMPGEKHETEKNMKGSLDEKLKHELKLLIVEECDLDISVNDIPDDDVLFGSESPIGLDSVDALQISLAVQNKYGVVITDSKELRRVMKSINSFADYIQPE